MAKAKESTGSYNGVRMTALEAPEWKHSILKFVARILYSRKANYVLVIHDFEPFE
jgi:hypothetical protein